MQKPTLLLVSLLAVALALVPAAAFAQSSYTVTVTTNMPSYTTGQTIVVSGTVTPVPTVASDATISIYNPNGALVDIYPAPVSTSTGTYSHSFVAGGTSQWIAGVYTVNVTWGAGTSVAKATTTFKFTPSVPTTVTAVPTAITVQAVAMSPVYSGSTLQVDALVQWSNGSPASVSFPEAYYVMPTGTGVNLGSPKVVAPGNYMWNVTLPSSAPDGLYAVYLEAKTSTGMTAWGLTGFTVNSMIANSSSVNSLGNQLSALSGAITTDYSSMMSSLASMSTMIKGISNSLSTDYSSLSSTLSSISSTMSTISSTFSSMSSSITSLQSSVSSLESTTSSLTTYLMVVAVLAIIIIVLELVLLVRKK